MGRPAWFQEERAHWQLKRLAEKYQDMEETDLSTPSVPGYFTLTEFAEIIGRSSGWLLQAISQKAIQAYRLKANSWLIPEPELAEYLADPFVISGQKKIIRLSDIQGVA